MFAMLGAAMSPGGMRVCMGERHAFSRWAATAMEHIEGGAMGAGGGGGFWAAMPQLTQLLLLLMVLDTALGVTRAIRAHDLSAHAAWRGNRRSWGRRFGGCCGVLNPYVQNFLGSIWCRQRALYIIPELTSVPRNAAALTCRCLQICGGDAVFPLPFGQQPDAGDEDR